MLKKPTEQVAHYRPAGEDAIGNQSGIHILIQSSAKLGTGWPPVWDNVLVGARECSFVLMMMLIRTRTIGDLREVQGKHCFRAFATTFHHNLSVHWGGGDGFFPYLFNDRIRRNLQLVHVVAGETGVHVHTCSLGAIISCPPQFWVR